MKLIPVDYDPFATPAPAVAPAEPNNDGHNGHAETDMLIEPETMFRHSLEGLSDDQLRHVEIRAHALIREATTEASRTTGKTLRELVLEQIDRCPALGADRERLLEKVTRAEAALSAPKCGTAVPPNPRPRAERIDAMVDFMCWVLKSLPTVH